MSDIDLITALRSLDEPVAPPEEVKASIWQPLAARLEPDQDLSSPKRSGRPTYLRRGWWIAGVAAATVLIAGIGAILLTGGQRPVGDPGERVSVPESHPAAALVAGEIPTYEEATSTLAASGDPFLCNENRASNWALCLVYSNGILGVVSFDNPEGTVARIQSEGLGEEVRVTVDGSQVIGFASSGGEVVLIVERDGEVAGSVQGMGSD